MAGLRGVLLDWQSATVGGRREIESPKVKPVGSPLNVHLDDGGKLGLRAPTPYYEPLATDLYTEERPTVERDHGSRIVRTQPCADYEA